ncbi:MAG TPA: SDR family NAD(P)-dependent oxidoreductase, partial [Candidatus Acidoferrales bacterium]|nr:SDR family NAD(P)-dependent oxidoreductase [Candidatus Acidoferrales bacterium]
MSEQRQAIVVGVGAEAGLGAALCKRFAREGLHVLVAGRTSERLDSVVAAIKRSGGTASAVVADTTREDDVVRLFEGACGQLDLVVFNAGNNQWADLLEMEASFFEEMWRVACFGGFLVGREAARRMVGQGDGTILFTGASGSLRGKPPFTAFASAKAGLRAVAQAMARDLGPKGIHVGHIVIDGGIKGDKILARFPQYAEMKGEDGMLEIDAIADAYWFMHTQHRTAWTHELDLR